MQEMGVVTSKRKEYIGILVVKAVQDVKSGDIGYCGMLLMRSAMRRASFCGSACANQIMVPIPKSAAMIQPAIAPIPRGVNSSGIRVMPLGAPERSSPSFPAAFPVVGIPLALHRSFKDSGMLMRCWATSGATINSAANPDSRCHSM